MWGICLGHQLLCRAVGLETFKLPFGHRGANHPVKDLETGRIEITSQNHGFAVLGPGGERTIDTDEPVRWETDFGAAELQQLNLYDRTVEGLVLRDVPASTVQYHPEAGPGPARRRPPVRPVRGRALPRRDDIQKILVVGSGPIVIGQAAEFDYSGAQACKVLLEEGYEVVLVNSNPATIMTDPEFATATYIEPLHAGVGGQGDRAREARTRCCPRSAAGPRSTWRASCPRTARSARHRVELIGADYEAIRRAEDRELFRATMERAGLRVPRSAAVKSMREAEAALPEIGLPAIVRPGFTMGGAGGGTARTEIGVPPGGRRGPGRQPDRPGAGRGVGDRLGRVRARGDARPRRQRRDRLLDREHRPDGRAHRRQRHRRAAADAHRHASTSGCATRRSR